MRAQSYLAAALTLFAVFVTATPAGAADPVLIREQKQGIDLKALDLGNGVVIDAALSEASMTGLTYKVFAGSRNITEETVATRPLALIVYGFRGIDAERQCAFKQQLDTLLLLGGRNAAAFSDVENEICGDAGIFPARPEAWRALLSGIGEYRRILSIQVNAEGYEPFFFAEDAQHWDGLMLSPSQFDDKRRLVASLSNFTETRTRGFTVAVPATAAAAGDIKVSFSRDGSEIAVFGTGSLIPGMPFPVDIKTLAMAGGGLVAVIVILVLLRRRRAPPLPTRPAADEDTPTHTTSFGNGPGVDYDLGRGEAGTLAIVEIYPRGRYRLVRVSAAARIEIDGKNIDDAAWIAETSTIRIEGRKIKFD